MIETRKNGHGGRRPGAGRPKGSIERFTSSNLKHFRERYPTSPLDHMMTVINAPPGTPGVTNARRDDMAKAAAPYLHQKLSSLELTGAEKGPEQYAMDLTKLTDEELMLFERMVIKAQRPLPPLLDLDPEDDEGGTPQ